MADEVHVHSHRRLLDDLFAVDEAYVTFQLPSGEMSEPRRRLSFERGDAAAAVVLDSGRRTVVLVRQFRYPTLSAGSGWTTELVAGMIGPGETPVDAMRREVLEETGRRVIREEAIHTFFTSPGGSSERIHLFLAEVDDGDSGSPVPRGTDAEAIEVVDVPLDDIHSMLDDGTLADAKTIIGLTWLMHEIDDRGRLHSNRTWTTPESGDRG